MTTQQTPAVDNVAARRKVLVETLMLCIERSPMCQKIDARTIRSLVEPGMSEYWRGGQVQLETLWRMLAGQPELGPDLCAPPFFLFKLCEENLGVQVILPPELEAVAPEQRAAFTDPLGVAVSEIAATVEGVRSNVTEQMQAAHEEQLMQEQQAAAEQQAIAEAPPPPQKKSRKGLAIGLTTSAMIAMSASVFLTFRSPESAFDVAGASQVLAMRDAVRQGPFVSALLEDPKWDASDKKAKEALMKSAYEALGAPDVEDFVVRNAGNEPLAEVRSLSGQVTVAVYK